MMNMYSKVLSKYTHRKRLDLFFWRFVMSMLSIVTQGESSKRTGRVENINIKFSPDPEIEPEVVIGLRLVGLYEAY